MSSDAFILQGTIDVDVNEAIKDLNKLDGKVEKSGGTMTSIFGKVGGLIAGVFATKKIADFGIECLGAASDVEEMENKFNVVFEGMESDVDQWASTFSDAIGRNKNEIKTYLADNQNMFVGMGMTREAGAEMSEQLVSLALDLASFNNLNEADAVEKMSKAIMGETESAKGLGAVLNDNTRAMAMETLGLQGKFSALSEAEKMQVNYQAILMQSTDAVGDAERSAGSYANQIRGAQAKVQEFCQTIGTFLLPIGTSVVTMFTNMVDGVIDFINGIAENWQNTGAPIIENIKTYFSDMGITTDTVMSTIKTIFQGAMEFLSTYWSSIGQPIFDLIMQVIGWTKDAFAEHMPQIQAFFSGFVEDAKNLWENHLKPCYEAIGNFISNVLAPVFEYVFNSSIVPTIERAFMFISGLWENSLKPIFTGIIDFITGVFSGNWSKAWQGIVQTLGGIFGGIVEVVKVPLNAVIGLINKAIGALNKISVDIPDWIPGVGGKTFGVNIPTISYLENGGILTQPTMLNGNIMAGEKNKGKSNQAEAVIPLDDLKNWITQLANRPVSVMINDKEIVTATVDGFDRENGQRLCLSERGLLV